MVRKPSTSSASRWIGFSVLFTTTTFALMPVAAQAVTEPHYFQSGVLQTAKPRTVVLWGTLAFRTVKGSGETICRTSVAGTIMNSESGGAGQGLIQVLAFFDCEKVACKSLGLGEPQMKAEHLPWSTKLESIGLHEARSTMTGVKYRFGCEEAPGREKFVPIVGNFGSTKPQTRNGGNQASNPGFVEFGPGSGELEQEPAGSGVNGVIEGKLNILGYANQEVIGVCDLTTAESAPSICV